MAVSDFRVYDTTEGWVSMGDVAADKVTLPVPSADGTVVLDSPSADTFTIETGGTERLRVDAAKIHAKTYVDFFDPAGDLSGRLQATATTFFVQVLGASRNFVIRQNGVDVLTTTNTHDVNIWQSIRAASGSASAPGFAIRGDTDTGTARAAARRANRAECLRGGRPNCAIVFKNQLREHWCGISRRSADPAE